MFVLKPRQQICAIRGGMSMQGSEYKIFNFFKRRTVLETSKWHLSQKISASTQFNFRWWRHNICLWHRNGARLHTRAKYYEYFVCEKAAKPLLFTDPIISLNRCICIPGNAIWYWIKRYFLTSRIFPNFYFLFCQSLPHRLRYYDYLRNY